MGETPEDWGEVVRWVRRSGKMTEPYIIASEISWLSPKAADLLIAASTLQLLLHLGWSYQAVTHIAEQCLLYLLAAAARWRSQR